MTLSIMFLAMLEPAPNANPSLRVCIREGAGTGIGNGSGNANGVGAVITFLVGEAERGIF